MKRMAERLNLRMKKLKLVHQINVAFGLTLLLVLSITGVMIHYVLMDHFIGTEQEGLRTLGASLTATLQQPPFAEGGILIGKKRAAYGSISYALQRSTGHRDRPAGECGLGNSPGPANGIRVNGRYHSYGAGSLQSLWDGNDPRYLVQVNTLPQGKLTLLTPVSRIKAIEQSLLKRLILVFAAGAAAMLLFSMFITRKLIDPLISLRQELGKVKNRRFAEVNLIRAGGEIGSVARAVYEMAGELHQFNRVQKQFFQNASHELKSPLMSIAGYAEGIKDGVFEGEGVRKGLDIILSESGRLRDLVSEMTLLAKLDSEEDIYQAADTDLEELLSEAVERVNPLLAARKLSLYPAVSGDHGGW